MTDRELHKTWARAASARQIRRMGTVRTELIDRCRQAAAAAQDAWDDQAALQPRPVADHQAVADAAVRTFVEGLLAVGRSRGAGEAMAEAQRQLALLDASDG